MEPTWLAWAPLATACLHICEEFVFPGGFIAWYKRYRVDASRVTPRFLILMNAALLIGCLEVGFLKGESAGAVCWLAITAVTFSNAVWHVWAAIRSRAYSPGIITGVLLYIPVASYGYAYSLRTRTVSLKAAIIAAVFGASYPFWSALYHGGRQALTRRRVA